jgi:predicted NBD/HSP70 family sugar kinase
MKKVLCGVDIGGTKLSTALVDHDGNIIDKLVVNLKIFLSSRLL